MFAGFEQQTPHSAGNDKNRVCDSGSVEAGLPGLPASDQSQNPHPSAKGALGWGTRADLTLA
jgi:hypothetical protein